MEEHPFVKLYSSFKATDRFISFIEPQYCNNSGDKYLNDLKELIIILLCANTRSNGKYNIDAMTYLINLINDKTYSNQEVQEGLERLSQYELEVKYYNKHNTKGISKPDERLLRYKANGYLDFCVGLFNRYHKTTNESKSHCAGNKMSTLTTQLLRLLTIGVRYFPGNKLAHLSILKILSNSYRHIDMKQVSSMGRVVLRIFDVYDAIGKTGTTSGRLLKNNSQSLSNKTWFGKAGLEVANSLQLECMIKALLSHDRLDISAATVNINELSNLYYYFTEEHVSMMLYQLRVILDTLDKFEKTPSP